MVSSRRRLQQILLIVLLVSGGLGGGWALLAVNGVLHASVAETPVNFDQGLNFLIFPQGIRGNNEEKPKTNRNTLRTN